MATSDFSLSARKEKSGEKKTRSQVLKYTLRKYFLEYLSVL